MLKAANVNKTISLSLIWATTDISAVYWKNKNTHVQQQSQVDIEIKGDTMLEYQKIP